MICGAGVIGQIYGGRLAAGGHDVTLLARGVAARSLAEHGVTLHKDDESWQVRPRVVTTIPSDTTFDLAFVTVRRDQLDDLMPQLATLAAEQVVFLLNNVTDLEALRGTVGAQRTLFGFPGVAGYRSAEATVS